MKIQRVKELFAQDQAANARHWAIVLLLATAPVQVVVWKLLHVSEVRFSLPATLLFVCMLAYCGIQQRDRLTLALRAILYTLCLALFAKASLSFFSVLNAEPRQWDFLCFYIDANVASSDLNLYQPKNYQAIAEQLGLDVDARFQREILETGFKYPPATALLFYPLSYFELNVANRIWLSTVFLILVLACIPVGALIRQVRASTGSTVERLDSTVLAASLIYALPFGGLGLMHGQTTGLLCALFALALIAYPRPLSGVSLAVAAIVKPIAALPSVLLVLARNWRLVAVAALTVTTICIASFAVLGFDDWASYVRLEFATSTPAWLYHEEGNRSLLATICRVLEFDGIPWENSTVTLLFFGSSGILVLVSFGLALKVMHTDFRLAFSMLLVTGLLIYPGTGYPYTVILAVPLVVAISTLLRKDVSEFLIASFAAVSIFLATWDLFVSNLFVFLVLATLCFQQAFPARANLRVHVPQELKT